MTKDNAVKVYNKLEVLLFDLDNLFYNTGTAAEFPNEARAFIMAGRELERKVETKFYNDGKEI